jgi:hypothetical protein
MKIAWLACALATSAVAQTYTIAGTVTDVAHGRPLERAFVSLLGPHALKMAVTTGADGRFSFAVPQGRYSLYAGHNGWRLVFGNPEPTTGFGSAVIAGPDLDTAHLAFRWYAPGAICGTVTDEQGEPVRDALVQLIREGIAGGRKRTTPAGWTRTDDRGQYRAGPLAAGNYYVVVTGRPWRETGAIGFQAPDAKTAASAYPSTYYPGTTDTRDATALTVRSGGEARADIALHASPGADVKVRCPGSGNPNDFCPGLYFELHGIGGVELLSDENLEFQSQSYRGVAPGQYTLRASSQGKSAYKVVDIGAGEYSFDLALGPPAVITGTVAFEGGQRPKAQVYVGIDSDSAAGSIGKAIDADGTFTIRMSGARLRPHLYGTIPLFIAELSADEKPVQDGAIDATDGSEVHLRILASGEMGRLKGFAMSGGHPAPAVLVVLAPAGGSPNPAHYQGFQTESDGSFDWPAVAAGDYVLFSVDKLDLEYTNPEAIRPYLSSATPVHIAAHTTLEQRVNVAAH